MKTNFLINYLFIILLVITLLLGFYGFYFEDSYKWYDAIYKTLQLFQLGAASPEQSVCINVARFLAPIVLIFGGMQLIMYGKQAGKIYVYGVLQIILSLLVMVTLYKK